MNFIEKHIHLICAVPFIGLLVAATVLYFEVPLPLSARVADKSEQRFTCPMHPQVPQAKPGNCKLCGMKLIAAGQPQANPGGSCCSKGTASAHDPAAGHSGCPHAGRAEPATPANNSTPSRTGFSH